MNKHASDDGRMWIEVQWQAMNEDAVGGRHGFYYTQSITITSHCFYYYYINSNLLLLLLGRYYYR